MLGRAWQRCAWALQQWRSLWPACASAYAEVYTCVYGCTCMLRLVLVSAAAALWGPAWLSSLHLADGFLTDVSVLDCHSFPCAAPLYHVLPPLEAL